MPTLPTSYRLVDVLLGGDLETRLRKWRAAGVSYRAIANLLEEETGERYTYDTIRRWCDDLDIDGDVSSPPDRAAS
jgi:hypothetical protein